MDNIFSERLKQLRKDKDTSAPTLADELEIDESTSSKCESEKRK